MIAKLRKFIQFQEDRDNVAAVLAQQWQDGPLPAGVRQTIQNRLRRWRELFDAHGLTQSSFQAINIEQTIRRAACSEVATRVDDLKRSFEADCADRYVEVIPPDLSVFMDRGFKDDRLNRRFPSAAEEMVEANCCYAFGRHTACVFHLMRAVEHALRVLVHAVGVTAPKVPLEYQVWAELIQQFESRTGDVPNHKSWSKPERERGREFYRGTVADLYSFKDETRNITMHTRRGLYDGPGALSVHNRVETFFGRIPDVVEEDWSGSLLDSSVFE